jgi:FMN-dependent oxidoreductase (nitrilotriacetate monooxygenase family)
MKPFTLGIFQVMSPNGMSGASWRHPDNTSLDFMDIDYWITLAKKLEAAKFDFLFLADTYGTPRVNGEVPDVAIEQAQLLPTADPMSMMSALAAATTDLGLVVTTATVFEPPYSNARRFATLDHFSKGRMGWNIVTGSSAESAALMFGKDLIPHDTRYDMGDEYIDLSFKLWEGSWQDDAVLADKTEGVFAVASRVHRVRHDGEHYQAEGVFQVVPSIQRTPVLFQAGSSGRGREFAARNAECVFLQGTTPQKVAASVEDIRSLAVGFGRTRDSVKILVGLTIFTAPTHEEAVAKHQGMLDLTTDEVAASSYVANTGIDLLALDPTKPIPEFDGQQGQSNIDRYRSQNGEAAPTVRQVLDEFKSRGLRGT